MTSNTSIMGTRLISGSSFCRVKFTVLWKIHTMNDSIRDLRLTADDQ